MSQDLYVIVDASDPQSPTFVEIEDENGRSVSIDWAEMPSRADKFFAIGPLQKPGDTTPCAETK